jgi:hypothetical protein
MDFSRTEPLRPFCRRRNISPTRVYKWDKDGLIVTVLIDGRRHVVVDSYDALVRRLVEEQAGARLPSSNPKVNRRAAG